MWTWAVLVFCVAVASAKNTFVIVTPTQMRPGQQLNVSVNILHATGPVNVLGRLKTQHGQVKASTHGSFSQGSPQTMTINVPKDIPSASSYKLEFVGSGGLTFTKSGSITYKSKNMSIFIQTDKAMYKPGQTVHFRTFAADSQLKVFTGKFTVEIFDSKSNKVKQWVDVSDPTGVITNYMTLTEEPVLGDWKIKVTAGHLTKEKTFTIAEYVLPKFEVTVELPSYGLNADDSVKATIRAMYTYGKPVRGPVHITTKLASHINPIQLHGVLPVLKQSANLDEEGKAILNIPLAQFKAHSALHNKKLVVAANVTESLTGITLSGNSTIAFHDNAYKVEFLKSNPKNFKPGLPYTAYAKVGQIDGRPLVGARLSLSVDTTVTYEGHKKPGDPSWVAAPTKSYHLPIVPYQIPDSGVIPISLTIPQNATKINIKATYSKVHTTLSLTKMYSPSNSYLQMNLKNSGRIAPGTVMNVELEATQDVDKVSYQIMSRGVIVQAGEVNMNHGRTKIFNDVITPEMAPNARLVCYYVRQNGEIVADSISFNVEGGFENQVSINFDKSKAEPGDNVHVRVTADPHSSVNLLAVDQSVLLLASGNDVTQGDVISELKSYDTITHSTHHSSWPIVPLGGIEKREKRSIWWWYPYPTYYGGGDATEIFKNAGVLVLTDATLYHHRQPVNPFNHHHHGFFFGSITDSLNNAVIPVSGLVSGLVGTPHVTENHEHHEQELQEPEGVRSIFPETWLWLNASTSADGSTQISTQVPDTITSWVASAFAVNPTTGLGVSPTTAKLETFRPFFVSLNLPYSIVRGEQVAIQANVFNYLTQDVDAVVTLLGSSEFVNIGIKDGHQTLSSANKVEHVHVKAGEAKSVFFPIVPSGLGQVDITVKAQSTVAADAVKRQILVEPEGIEKDYNTPVLVDLKQQTTFNQDVQITLPPNTVAGSERVRISAIGDLMGPTITNLDKLLKMPTGCGEQTMIGFAPDIFVSKYLSITGQLTGQIEQRSQKVMEHGYQRELTFQHKDGSFSAFGDRDHSGSMWLSAFVTKSFHMAKPYLFIDDHVIERAISWMIGKQSNDGSFPEPGRVIHKNMQGGSAKGPALTAFVLISLLENKGLGSSSFQHRVDQAVTKATHYLETAVSQLTDDYSLAIAGYALTLAESSAATQTMTRLYTDAIVEGGLKHWHETGSLVTTNNHHHHTVYRPPHKQAPAIDIETTAYALLTVAKHQDVTGGMSIMKWISAQRNPRGGFSSTQDTVLALQALSDFAGMIFASDFSVDVDVSAGQEKHHFSIDSKNALVMQTYDLPSIPSSVSIKGVGHGMALVEVAVFYNVEDEIEAPSFDVSAVLKDETMDHMTVHTCSRWLGTGTSGMAVHEIGIPTGFEADQESISESPMLKRIEAKERKIVLYLEQVGTSMLCFDVTMYRTSLVAKSQPVAIRVFDYYEPDNQVTKFYQSSVLKNSSICDVCLECGCRGS